MLSYFHLEIGIRLFFIVLTIVLIKLLQYAPNLGKKKRKSANKNVAKIQKDSLYFIIYFSLYNLA